MEFLNKTIEILSYLYDRHLAPEGETSRRKKRERLRKQDIILPRELAPALQAERSTEIRRGRLRKHSRESTLVSSLIAQKVYRKKRLRERSRSRYSVLSIGSSCRSASSQSSDLLDLNSKCKSETSDNDLTGEFNIKIAGSSGLYLLRRSYRVSSKRIREGNSRVRSSVVPLRTSILTETVQRY